MEAESECRGAPMSAIIGSHNKWGAPEFPPVRPSSSHSVLYNIPSMLGDRVPLPHVSREQDVWDHDFVRMPCSSQNLYSFETESGQTVERARWEMIKEALSSRIRNSNELARAILSYNEKYRDEWTFRGLHKFFNEFLDEDESRSFFCVTLPEIVKMALALPDYCKAPIPLLRQDKNHSVSLSQVQIVSLLANAFFCTFPRRSTTKKNAEYENYHNMNFTRLYETSEDTTMEKFKCIFHYFRRVTTYWPRGVVTFSRRSVQPQECPKWDKSEALLAGVPLHVDSVTRIEDFEGLIQIDFANKYLGGGVLGHGSVQEEIRFLICPELMISILFTEVLERHEALIMIGCERYSNYSGYSGSFKWASNYEDNTLYDASCRRRCAVLAIDAQLFRDKKSELQEHNIVRELDKAWTGVSFYTDKGSNHLNYPGIATGNWGCGVFGGSPQMKSLIQIMACAQARRPIAYGVLHDHEFKDKLINIFEMLKRYHVTVGELFTYILRFAATGQDQSKLFSFLYRTVEDKDQHRTPPKTPKNRAKNGASGDFDKDLNLTIDKTEMIR